MLVCAHSVRWLVASVMCTLCGGAHHASWACKLLAQLGVCCGCAVLPRRLACVAHGLWLRCVRVVCCVEPAPWSSQAGQGQRMRVLELASHLWCGGAWGDVRRGLASGLGFEVRMRPPGVRAGLRVAMR